MQFLYSVLTCMDVHGLASLTESASNNPNQGLNLTITRNVTFNHITQTSCPASGHFLAVSSYAGCVGVPRGVHSAGLGGSSGCWLEPGSRLE
jgi:hypothetical protein